MMNLLLYTIGFSKRRRPRIGEPIYHQEVPKTEIPKDPIIIDDDTNRFLDKLLKHNSEVAERISGKDKISTSTESIKNTTSTKVNKLPKEVKVNKVNPHLVGGSLGMLAGSTSLLLTRNLENKLKRKYPNKTDKEIKSLSNKLKALIAGGSTTAGYGLGYYLSK